MTWRLNTIFYFAQHLCLNCYHFNMQLIFFFTLLVYLTFFLFHLESCACFTLIAPQCPPATGQVLQGCAESPWTRLAPQHSHPPASTCGTYVSISPQCLLVSAYASAILSDPCTYSWTLQSLLEISLLTLKQGLQFCEIHQTVDSSSGGQPVSYHLVLVPTAFPLAVSPRSVFVSASRRPS